MRKFAENEKPRGKKAGHRSWAAANSPVAGTHRGDIMSPEKRSAVMAKIKGKNTGPERRIQQELRSCRIRFVANVSHLPGRPDIVFSGARLAVFIDGDFWHGWRFPLWQHKLSDKWQQKISANRKRDQRNFRKLRRLGWKVLRVWEHETELNLVRCVAKILAIRQQCLRRKREP